MQSIADELFDKWADGKLEEVVNSIVSETPARAAILAALLTTMMLTPSRTIFFHMLMSRI